MAPVCFSTTCASVFVLGFTGSISKVFCSTYEVWVLISVVKGKPLISQGVKDSAMLWVAVLLHSRAQVENVKLKCVRSVKGDLYTGKHRN